MAAAVYQRQENRTLHVAIRLWFGTSDGQTTWLGLGKHGGLALNNYNTYINFSYVMRTRQLNYVSKLK